MLLWITFAAVALATALAVQRLYAAVVREIDGQSRQAVAEQTAKAQQLIRETVEQEKRTLIKNLARLHVEGLGYALRQWAKRDPRIVGTFEWDPAQGFARDAVFPSDGPSPASLPSLWQSFREWRHRHPDAKRCDLDQVAAYRVNHYQTVGNPNFPVGELEYQGENIDIVTYAKQIADPWAGWAAAPAGPEAPAIVWYQVTNDGPVRGCLVDVRPLVVELQQRLAESTLTRTRLAAHDPQSHGAVAAVASLPGYDLSVQPGGLFAEKRSAAGLAAAAAVLLLGVFLGGAAFLVRYSQRETQEAERKTSFVAQVSHELRTPITSMRMFADMLTAADVSTEKRIRFATTISRETERLAGLIDRLLTFSALERHSRRAVFASVDIVQVVTETIEQLQGTIEAAGMQIETAFVAPSVSAPTDRDAVKQALLNLVENALKYARRGGLIRISVARDAAQVRIVVADAGPGIEPALRNRVFDPFVQGGHSLSDKPSGLGLGLSIARGMLRHAGADLVLVPSPVGAVFEIRLPSASTP